ncbi:hypothetical protein H4R20_000903 [Coemansia guatemalensis]|uniref:Uncharacterized protein n=1 Tax=Coemansia guatemalensis TaxID=2761395 RepID=A0A9W8LWH3_9FUNG|nr:hypothetical protein H4R20_000903 [Coemansia guatemalensis]
MPRPARKTAAKRAVETEPARKTAHSKSTADKENASATTASKVPTRRSTRTKAGALHTVDTTPVRKRALKADAVESKEQFEESPPKRSHVVQRAGTPRSPGVSPQYGRRASALYGRAPLTPVSQRSRRASGGEGLVVFDDLIDGISPIKHGRPMEREAELRLSDQEAEADGLPLPQDLLSENKADAADTPESVGERSGPRTRSRSKPEQLQKQQPESPKKEPQNESSEDSDSEDFDLDAFMARSGRKANGAGSRSTRRDAALAAGMASGKVTVMDLVDKDGAASELPRRHRTQQHNGNVAPAPAARRNGRAGTKTRAKKASKDSDGTVPAANGTQDDSWKPDKKPLKGRTRATSTSNKQRGKAQQSARAKQTTATPDIWSANVDVAKYFDDIDGFQLVEEQV